MTTITDEPFRADVDEVLARYGLDDPGHAVLASDLSDAFDEAIRDAAAEVSRLRAEIASYRDHPGREYCHYCHAIFDVPSEAADNHWRECQSHPLRAEVERLTKERNEQAELVVHLHEWKEKAMKAYRDPSALAAVPAPPSQADDRLLAVAERAVNLLISDIYETLMGMVYGWRDIAHDHYCQTHNKGMGKGLEVCAKHLEAYLNGMYQRDRAAVARRAVDAEGGNPTSAELLQGKTTNA